MTNIKKKFSIKYFCLVSSLISFVLICDLLTKYFLEGVSNLTIINGFLSFHSAKNFGAAWSVFSGHIVFLILISIVFFAIIFVYNHFATGKNLLYYISLSFIVGGALGNFIDRIFLGYVRDFIRFDFVSFPIFNIADSSLSVGVFLFFVYFLFYYPKVENKR